IKAEKEVPVSTKKERNYITKGNELFNEGKYHEAINKYQEALKENPMSVVGRYNMGLSEIKIGTNPNDTTESAKKILESGCKNMEIVANLGKTRPDLASKANYNLGNVAFNSNEFQKAINYYKQALRFNPDDNDARRNLRIAQLKLQNEEQNEDQNQDQEQNQDQQDQQEENKDQNQDQDQEQNQDQDQNQDQNEEQQQDQQPDISQQNAEQILNAIENKENQTRARVAGQNAEKSRQRNRNKRNW
ncbi:MAG: tetratricopeptide repeat protein, partial [Muribaculaceae bacterium]|nr:tetratricopeptide repeat protein [Muribaculaceae bacterium]